MPGNQKNLKYKLALFVNELWNFRRLSVKIILKKILRHGTLICRSKCAVWLYGVKMILYLYKDSLFIQPVAKIPFKAQYRHISR